MHRRVHLAIASTMAPFGSFATYLIFDARTPATAHGDALTVNATTGAAIILSVAAILYAAWLVKGRDAMTQAERDRVTRELHLLLDLNEPTQTELRRIADLTETLYGPVTAAAWWARANASSPKGV